MSEVDGQIGELNAALADMHRAFDRTHDQWRDSTREEFYIKFIQPLEQEWEQASKAIAHISSVIAQVRSECSN